MDCATGRAISLLDFEAPRFPANWNRPRKWEFLFLFLPRVLKTPRTPDPPAGTGCIWSTKCVRWFVLLSGILERKNNFLANELNRGESKLKESICFICGVQKLNEIARFSYRRMKYSEMKFLPWILKIYLASNLGLCWLLFSMIGNFIYLVLIEGIR